MSSAALKTTTFTLTSAGTSTDRRISFVSNEQMTPRGSHSSQQEIETAAVVEKKGLLIVCGGALSTASTPDSVCCVCLLLVNAY